MPEPDPPGTGFRAGYCAFCCQFKTGTCRDAEGLSVRVGPVLPGGSCVAAAFAGQGPTLPAGLRQGAPGQSCPAQTEVAVRPQLKGC